MTGSPHAQATEDGTEGGGNDRGLLEAPQAQAHPACGITSHALGMAPWSLATPCDKNFQSSGAELFALQCGYYLSVF